MDENDLRSKEYILLKRIETLFSGIKMIQDDRFFYTQLEAG